MVCCLIDKNWAKRVAALRADPFLHKVILALLAADIYLAVISFVKLLQTMDAEANLSVYFPDQFCDLPMRALVLMEDARNRGSVFEEGVVPGGNHGSSSSRSDNDAEAMAVALAFVKKHFFLRRVLCGASMVAAIVNFHSIGAFHALHFWDHLHGPAPGARETGAGSSSRFCSALDAGNTIPVLDEDDDDDDDCEYQHAAADQGTAAAAAAAAARLLYSGPSQLGEDLTKPLSDWTKGTIVVHAMASSFIAFVASLVGLGLMWHWSAVCYTLDNPLLWSCVCAALFVSGGTVLASLFLPLHYYQSQAAALEARRRCQVNATENPDSQISA